MFGANTLQSSIFGTPKTTGFTFGTPSTAAATTPGFGFGSTTQSAVGSAGTLFSSTATAATPSSITPAFTKPGLTFGQPSSLTSVAGAAPSSGLFGTTTAQSGFSGLGTFGTPSSGVSATGLGLSTSMTPSLGMGFSAPLSTSTSTPSLGLGMFGAPATTTTAPSLGLGLFGSQSASTTMAANVPTLGLGGSQTAPVAITGLGGVSTTQKTDGSSGDGNDSKTLKEYPVPPEIINPVEEFKKYIKDQKNIREEIARYSPKSLTKVQEETATLKQLLSVISNGIQRNLVTIRQMKQDTIQELQNAEIMQRTKDVPLALQYENTAPMEYFQRLISSFENKMQTYRQQIKMLEKHLGSITQPSGLTPQELVLAIKKIHETFIFLAAELQTIHETVGALKDRYLTYRRLVHGDNTNVFDSNKTSTTQSNLRLSHVPVAVGPSPFNEVQGAATAAAFASALEKTQHPAGTTTSLTVPFGISTGISGPSMFGMPSFATGSSSLAVKPLGTNTTSLCGLSTSAYGNLTPSTSGVYGCSPSTPSVAMSNRPFQLQKPPTGNKRGKR